MKQKKDLPVSYKDTLNLPHTEFPIRPNAKIDDPSMIVRWQTSNLYDKAYVHNEGSEKYILHIGPPYANGHIHLGHAYNNILKDIITKSYRMAGYQVPVKPGWDCHGLPIEIKVTEANPHLSRLELIRACRTYAQHWLNTQRTELKDLGIIMDWDHPYETMAPSYEASTVRAFGILLEKGFIERKNKTVTWCPSCQTVLANAEIEYKDRKDPSIYVRFEMDPADAVRLFPTIKGEPVSFLIWTTTPWTIPLNRGVMLNPKAEYVLARVGGHLLIVGSEILSSIEKLLEEKATVLEKIPAKTFEQVRIIHPFEKGRFVPVVFDDSVSLTEGTACVHTAPGSGPLDYEVGVRNDLEIYSPITPDGKYTEDVKPEDLKGIAVSQAHGEIIKRLQNAGTLFYKASVRHSYPHCWRCHNPLIFRATKQWFFDLEHDDVKRRALEAVEKIDFMPPQGRNFLRATIESRWEWCLSRQRVWGVPIPAILCKKCEYVFCTPELVNKVATAIAHEGVEYWQRVELEELFDVWPSCPGCENAEWEKEYDILDVWFDAGVSHYAVLYHKPPLQFPANLYLEGVDQHRGWFQSSLLTALVLEGQAPTKAIMTHGFTVDEKGQKMSKSLGNVVAPQQIVDRLGTDGLRLWVASVGNEGDAVVSDALLQNVGEVYRKIRNTARFLLANLYDFNPDHDRVSVENMFVIDRTIVARLAALNEELISAYKKGDFTVVFHGLTDFCSVTLSSWYLDIVKDRLYVEKATGHPRRSAQTACYYLLDTLTRLMAPIMSFAAEQISDIYQREKKESIHLQPFAVVPAVWRIIAEEQGARDEKAVAEYITYQNKVWTCLEAMRDAVLKAIEQERMAGLIKHSLEAHVTIAFDTNLPDYVLLERFFKEVADSGQSVTAFLKEFFIVSILEVIEQADTKDQELRDEAAKESKSTVLAHIDVKRAEGIKCPRCWHYDESDHLHGLCKRCVKLVE